MSPAEVPDATGQLGRALIAIGVVLVIAGLIFVYAKQLRFGSLPGDITLAGRNWHVGIWIGTSLVLSLILTVALNLFLRRR